jgi:hypothetical protein
MCVVTMTVKSGVLACWLDSSALTASQTCTTALQKVFRSAPHRDVIFEVPIL